MLVLKNSSKYFAFGLIALFLAGNLFTGAAQSADAGYRVRHKIKGDAGYRVRHKKKGHHLRYQNRRYYPSRGRVIYTLPRRSRRVVHGGVRYHYFGGVWYRPHRSRFVIVAPPFGAVVPILPPYYSVVWVGARPFYYANDVYYTHSGDGYVVVEPPAGEVSKVLPPSNRLFIYPSNGQSQEQQADDRYACHSWAVGQTGYDPTRLDNEVPEADSKQAGADYKRAMGACLEARGYSVK